jgi:hypothetical protein
MRGGQFLTALGLLAAVTSLPAADDLDKLRAALDERPRALEPKSSP